MLHGTHINNVFYRGELSCMGCRSQSEFNENISENCNYKRSMHLICVFYLIRVPSNSHHRHIHWLIHSISILHTLFIYSILLFIIIILRLPLCFCVAHPFIVTITTRTILCYCERIQFGSHWNVSNFSNLQSERDTRSQILHSEYNCFIYIHFHYYYFRSSSLLVFIFIIALFVHLNVCTTAQPGWITAIVARH